MDKWDKLKSFIKAELSHAVHYSFERSAENWQLNRVKKWMEHLEEQEAKENERQSRGIEDSSEEI